MSEKHHWREVLPGKYLGAWSLNGEDKILTIKSAGSERVVGMNGKNEDLLVIRWVENELPMVCNRTNAKVISTLYGKYLEDWRGKKIQLYSAPTRFGGEVVDGLRVRPTVPKPPKAIKCEGCGNMIGAAASMSAEQLAEYTKSKYGKMLCSTCATKARTEQTKQSQQGDEK